MGGISRRDFIKLGVVASGSAVLAGCQTPSQWVTLEPYVRPPEEQLAGTATWYASTCRQCPAGCGIVTRIMNGRAKKIEGNGEHPLNQGKSCARGQAALQVLYDPDRLTSPARQSPRGTRQFAPISWNEGINSLFERVRAAGDHIAVWGNSTMSGHLYDLFSRLTGALGAPSPITFDLYTAYHGYALLRETSRRLFGRAALPSYDLGRADVVFSFGADLASTWLSAVRYGAEFGGLRSQELGKRGYLVQLEPKMSITGAKADRWLPIRPGAEGIVAQAIARIIADKSLGSTERASLARAFAGTTTVNEAAAASDLSASTLGELARIFAQAGRPLAIPGSTLTGQTNGADALAAVQSLNLIAGNVNAAGGMGLDAAPPLAT
ncbi:MAG: molybdopterin-dependent oxidoreductase, partial [Chloroflexi bacterium]|nr:molybdopterin-dependent oxidoreductase [Chloroflexota bacterium]